MKNLNHLPSDLPIPEDDGLINYLKGMKLPIIWPQATHGKTMNIVDIKDIDRSQPV